MTKHLFRMKSNNLCWDSLGMGTSCLCAVHCAALPLVMAMMPGLASTWLHGPLVHALLAIAVLSFCALGPLPGYLQHRNKTILIGMVVGVSLVLFATFLADALLGEGFEVGIISVGNGILILTHFRNRKITRNAQCHHLGEILVAPSMD